MDPLELCCIGSGKHHNINSQHKACSIWLQAPNQFTLQKANPGKGQLRSHELIHTASVRWNMNRLPVVLADVTKMPDLLTSCLGGILFESLSHVWQTLEGCLEINCIEFKLTYYTFANLHVNYIRYKYSYLFTNIYEFYHKTRLIRYQLYVLRFPN